MAIVFALAVVMLLLCVGLAIDGARAYNISTRVSAALDAAALAAAKMLEDEDNTEAEIRERAQRFLAAHLSTTPVAGVSLGSPTIEINRARGIVDLEVNVEVPLTFGRLAGFGSFTFPRAARVVYMQRFIELAMVLDITGSMCDPCSKMDGLKAAAREVVANLLSGSAPYGYVRIALVPYSGAVNAGAFAAAVSDGASTDGCVVERPGSHNADDHPAHGGNALGVASTVSNPRYWCPPAPVMPLNADRATLEAQIDALSPGGWTAGHIGAAWGWYTLSRRWNGVWPSESRPRNPAANVVKAVLLMTDGEFNTSYIPGAGLNSPDAAVANSSAEQTSRLCAAMKADDVIVYAVAFQAPPAAETLLRGCASSSSHYFSATTSSDLFVAFRTIAERLSALRVAL